MQAIYDKIESKPERYELNLYIAGEDEEQETAAVAATSAATDGAAPAEPASPEGSTT